MTCFKMSESSRLVNQVNLVGLGRLESPALLCPEQRSTPEKLYSTSHSVASLFIVYYLFIIHYSLFIIYSLFIQCS